jgi:two-component system, NarL family, invasion response regulator UvrY
MNGGLRILLVDDHPIVRRGLRLTLEDYDGIGDIGEAGSAEEALDLLHEHEWDAVILDVGLPGRGGIDVLKEIKRERPRLAVLVLSMQPEDQYAVRAVRAGAAGYLTKGAAPERLAEAVRKIAAGGRFISEDVADLLAIDVNTGHRGPPHESLSDREFEVLRLIGSGLSVGDIADRLSLSVKTVSSYRARILEKMHLKNNAELTHYVVAHSLAGPFRS